MVLDSDTDSDVTLLEDSPEKTSGTPKCRPGQRGAEGGEESEQGEAEGLRRSNRKRRRSINYSNKPARKSRAATMSQPPRSPGKQDEEVDPSEADAAGAAGDQGEDLSVLGQIRAMRASLEHRMDKTSSKIDKLDSKLTARIDKQDKELKKMNKKIDNNTKMAKDNCDDFAKLKAFVDKRSEDLPAAISKIVDEKLRRTTVRPRPLGPGGQGGGPSTSAGILNRDNYWAARKSLRIWPICGEGNLEMPVRGFLTNVLKLESSRVAALEFTVKPLEDKPQREGGPATPKRALFGGRQQQTSFRLAYLLVLLGQWQRPDPRRL